ncbi:hypothetical protein [Aeromonas sp. JL9]|uniref:hypothetical protein n=1 Tax=Aeromonas sp. JL9 TaxID=2950549 RepID=UPI00210AB710|nr:hypothetical protein [Aeromonas sp. JL9]MCQ4111570.1 hypothetical protein [Aeromonas sp. JL9]
MIRYFVVLIFSVLYFVLVDGFTPTSPFPVGVYSGIRYRISSEEPNAQITTKVEVSRDGAVRQKITIKDESIDSYAAFMFDGELGECELTTCKYIRTANVLLKPDINESIFDSKYLELLSKAKGKGKLLSSTELMFKNKEMVVVLDVDRQTPNLYTISKN